MSQEAVRYVQACSPFMDEGFFVHLSAAYLHDGEPFHFGHSDVLWWPFSKSLFEKNRATLLEAGFLTEVKKGGRGGTMVCRFDFPTVPVLRPLAPPFSTLKRGAKAEIGEAVPLIEFKNNSLGVLGTQEDSASGSRSKPKVPFPSGNFILTAEMRKWAEKNGMGYLNLREETEKFRDFHVARSNKFADWVAAWRNWMRNAKKFNPESFDPYKPKPFEPSL